MSIEQKLIIAAIIIEFGLVILMVFAALFFKFYYVYAENRKKILFDKIKNHFTKIALEKKNIDEDGLPRRWINLEALINAIVQIDMEIPARDWQASRTLLIKKIILPLARSGVSKRNWTARYYAAEAFNLGFEDIDEENIVKLTCDEIPMVYLRATSAAIAFSSKATIKAVIDRTARKRWITKSSFLQAFDNAPLTVRPLVEHRLKTTQIHDVKSACYAILGKFPPAPITWDILADIHSKEFEVRLASIKFFAYADPEKAIPVLIKLLKDKHWEVRLVALHRLEKLHAVSAMQEIAACLHDKEWWVKISAARALRSFGADGENLLRKTDPSFTTGPDISQHIANTWW